MAADPSTIMSPADFPIRVAAVDIGSNAIRLTAAEFLDPSHYVMLDSQRVPVRLGHSAFLTGFLTAENMDLAVEALSTFRRMVDAFGVAQHRVVATSAVRESRNGGELAERVRRESGLDLETITGSEEARLVWLAARNRIPLAGRWMLMDLGGGSLEVSVFGESGIEWSESHTMGTVRLLEELGGASVDQESLARLIAEYTQTLRIPSLNDEGLEGLIATGGNIEALAELAGCDPDHAGVSRLPVEGLTEVRERLAGLDHRERIDRFGLREDRADVILPAAYVYGRVAELAGAREFLVPHVGVKEGVLLDLVEDLTTHTQYVSNQEREVVGAAVALGRRYRFDEPHARQVARLALSLFDQLQALHELHEADRRILLGAALLHDIGQYVSYRKHHKHSLYLIIHGELSVFSPAEIPLVALVARYHRRALPKPGHFVWEELDEADRERVTKLAAILRVADALDREHLQRVDSVTVEVGEASVVLSVKGHGDLLLEHWALEKKGALFERAFDREPLLSHEQEAA
ncbi:MAG: Ppx/GppA phosphatase family protein [Longimicrobiales bacterium]